MVYRAIFLAAVFLISWTPVVMAQGEWSGNINLFGGRKQFDDGELFWKDDLVDISMQDEFGIKLDFKQDKWPISIAIGYLQSSGDDSGMILGVDEDVEATVSELRLGVRKIWEIWDESSYAHPFIGGGLANVVVNYKFKSVFFGIPSISDSDSTMGFWLDGGIYWTLAEGFNIGAELSYSTAQVTLFNEDIEAGGLHYGVLLGYHW